MGDTDRVNKELRKEIFKAVNEIAGNINFSHEEFIVDDFVTINAYMNLNGKKIKLTPISFGESFDTIQGKIEKFDYVFPHISLKNLEGKIAYIKNISNLKTFHYLIQAKPKAVLTNTEIKKPIYIKDFPVFYIPSLLNDQEVIINTKTKRKQFTGENIYFDIGVGAYFIYLHFPFDSRFHNIQSMSFYSTYKTFLELIDKLVKIKHPKGYRIRILITDLMYSNYAGLMNHLKNTNYENILSIFHLENSGAGNEKLVLKNVDNIIDNFHLNRIKKIFSNTGWELKDTTLQDFSNIDYIKIPIIWFTSYPNERIYFLTKDFLNDKLTENFANQLFYIINNLYRESK